MENVVGLPRLIPPQSDNVVPRPNRVSTYPKLALHRRLQHQQFPAPATSIVVSGPLLGSANLLHRGIRKTAWPVAQHGRRHQFLSQPPIPHQGSHYGS